MADPPVDVTDTFLTEVRFLRGLSQLHAPALSLHTSDRFAQTTFAHLLLFSS